MSSSSNPATIGPTLEPSRSVTIVFTAYPILKSLASSLTPKDLYHLARTNRLHFSSILGSKELFQALRRQCICDGRGLQWRRDSQASTQYLWPYWVTGDEYEAYAARMRARVGRAECGESKSFPCFKCGINVCEECRDYPREEAYHPRFFGYPRPHLDAAYQPKNIMYLCPPCDEEAEKKSLETLGSDRCDCNLYTRWICMDCVEKEDKFTGDYCEMYRQFRDFRTTRRPPRTKTIWEQSLAVCSDRLPPKSLAPSQLEVLTGGM